MSNVYKGKFKVGDIIRLADFDPQWDDKDDWTVVEKIGYPTVVRFYFSSMRWDRTLTSRYMSLPFDIENAYELDTDRMLNQRFKLQLWELLNE